MLVYDILSADIVFGSGPQIWRTAVWSGRYIWICGRRVDMWTRQGWMISPARRRINNSWSFSCSVVGLRQLQLLLVTRRQVLVTCTMWTKRKVETFKTLLAARVDNVVTFSFPIHVSFIMKSLRRQAPASLPYRLASIHNSQQISVWNTLRGTKSPLALPSPSPWKSFEFLCAENVFLSHY